MCVCGFVRCSDLNFISQNRLLVGAYCDGDGAGKTHPRGARTFARLLSTGTMTTEQKQTERQTDGQTDKQSQQRRIDWMRQVRARLETQT